jgi:CHAT domain-containing protein
VRRDSDRCPDPELLAAFVAGNLTGAELKMVSDHVLECEDCRTTIAEAAQYDRTSSTRETQPHEKQPARPWWLAAAAAALIGVTALSFWFTRSTDSNEWIHVLVEESPQSARYVEPRLSGGFPWAPLKVVRRGPNQKLDPTQMKFIGVAGDVLDKTSGDTSSEAQHASAVASLLAGDPREAAAVLGQVAKDSPDARVWSDLAAARYNVAVAVEPEDARQLAQALAAADTALRIDPRLPEGLFNRALILEHLGLRDQARATWQKFLDVDSGSQWTQEAESHLAALKSSALFKDELERNYDRLTRDTEAAAELAARFPQDARVWGESEILSRWARSEMAGDSNGANAHLQLARFFGDALAQSRGERLLRDAVRAILCADGGTVRTLVSAHIEFREAQKTYKALRPAEAGMRFRVAAAGFHAAGSPMELAARYFAANTEYDQGHIEEARTQLEGLLVGARGGYAAHTAQVKWELGLVYASLGHWGQSMRTFRDSIAGFDRLGETRYAMTVREILAEVYDRLGEPREAWSHRVAALRELGQNDDFRLRVTFHAIARGAALSRDWPVTLSFLDLETAEPRHAGDDMMYVNALLTRARIRGHLGAASAALTDYERATAAMTRLADSTLTERAEAERLTTQAFLATSPAHSIELLTKAIDFHRSKGRRMFLPELLLRRGRAFVASGSPDMAAIDFDSGIGELETQRGSIPDADDRWGIFGAAEELFDEAASLALQRHDEPAALAYCERALGRELLDSLHTNNASAMHVSPRGAAGALVLEYLVLPRRLVIFVIDGSRTRAVQEDVEAVTLENEVAVLSESAVSGDPAEFKRIASRLYDRLVAPVGDELTPGRMLVVVPNQTLAVVPFAALIDRSGRYLIESRAIVVAPSVATFDLLSARTGSPRPLSRLLLVTGPASQDGDSARLTASRREADAVAAMYRDSENLAPPDDPAELLERRAADADVIHFVGHSMIPDSTSGAALVTSRREGLAAQLDNREIAAMRLHRIRVVVLAACGTARAYGRTGETSISIARAFLAAGASSVVATLWPIDETPAAEFFPRIHSHLARGLSPAEALRAAQLEGVHRRHTPPGVWAAVEVIGS